MNANQRLTLVIPCYNEAVRLDAAALNAALRDMEWLDFCFVNDGSTDTTGNVLIAFASAWGDRVHILTLDRNQGKAEAVRQGLAFASARSTICGFWDADLSAPLSEVAELRTVFDRLPHVDWVWAIRLRSLGRNIERRPLRHYLGRFFATATSMVLSMEVYDTQCGAKLFRSNPLLAYVLSEKFTSRWLFDVEMLSRADSLLRHSKGVSAGQMVYEQPLSSWVHQSGSKVGPGAFAIAAFELMRINQRKKDWQRAIPSHE